MIFIVKVKLSLQNYVHPQSLLYRDFFISVTG